MIYQSQEQATFVARAFRMTVACVAVRVEKCDGGWRAVYDHYASVGRKASSKKRAISRKLIAGWNANIVAELWEALAMRRLSEEQANALRAALEPQLPPRWRFGARWYESGWVHVICEGKKTLVTSHCADYTEHFPEEKAFRDAIRQEPANALHRLAFSDWLAEQGREEEASEQKNLANSKN